MDLFRCIEPGCTQRGIYYCKCAIPPYFFCEEHVRDHSAHPTKTNLPDSFVSHAEPKILNLADICSTYQSYIFPTSTSKPYIFKYELSPILLPEEYKEYFKKLFWFFITKLSEIPRNKLDEVKNEEIKLYNTLQKNIMNIKFSTGEIHSLVVKKFDDTDDKMLKVSYEFIKDSLGSSLRDEYTPLFKSTKKINEIFNEIQTETRQGESSLEKFMSLFKKKLSNFVVNENLFAQQLEDLKKRLVEEAKSAQEDWGKKVFEYLMEMIVNKDFLQFVFYRAAQFDGFKKQVFEPEWIACGNLLLMKEDIELCCVEQLLSDSYISLLKFKDSKKTALINISNNDLSSTLILIKDCTNLIIPSGISEFSLILIQNHPRVLYYYTLTDTDLREDTSKRFASETNYDITSAAYLSWKDTIVFITSSNELIAKNICNSSNPEKIQLALESDEKLIDIQSKNSKKLVFLRTSIYYYIFDESFKELLRFKALGVNVSVFDGYCDSRLLFVSIYDGKIYSWEIILPEDLIKRLSIKLEEPNILGRTINFTANIFNRRVTVERKSVYKELVNEVLPPLEIKVVKSGDSSKSITLTNNYWSLVPKPILLQQPSHPTQAALIHDHGKISINPFQNRKPLPLSSSLTIAHCKVCGEKFSSNTNICENKHYCTKLCEVPGMCSKFGRNYCNVELTKNSSHNIHNCCSEFHSCTEKCPVKDCFVYCSRRIGHKGPHKCSVHYGLGGRSCNNECFNANHKHYVECKCGVVKRENHCESENMDVFEFGCEEFWKSHGWEGFDAIGLN